MIGQVRERALRRGQNVRKILLFFSSGFLILSFFSGAGTGPRWDPRVGDRVFFHFLSGVIINLWLRWHEIDFLR